MALAILLIAAVVAASGCVVRREALGDADKPRVDETTERVPLEGAEKVSVRLEMGAGELSVTGDELADDAMQADFSFSPATLKPETDIERGDDSLEITVSHPDVTAWNFGTRRFTSEWDLTLAEGVPLDLTAALGAGDGELDLSGLDLTDLRVDMGAGDVTVDLSGPRESDLDARITAGVGSVEVRLPSNVGVRVSGRQDGLGDWSYDGFTVDGEYLVNDAYGETDTSIELDVQRGIGEVRLELVD
jgi:hypothetical protein